MGCNCTKGTRANANVENHSIINNVNFVKERRSKPNKTSKKKKKSASDNIVASEETVNNNNEPAFRLLIPIDAKNNDEPEKKVNLERKSSRSIFQRRPTTIEVAANNTGTLQQPKMTRISSVSNGERGAQVMAGWPSWLASVAGEAINGWIPRKADSFEKLEKIGQGTYSSVYKARDLETNQLVALKKVRFANMDPESVRFMAREIIILRRLDHPNVMKLEGLITSRVSGSMYLIFEYMEHDLAGLASTPGVNFSEAQIKCYMKQLLHGLEHCHSRGVLHRDIKGSNLLLDHNNNLKIGDFGLANFYGSHQKQPLTSRVVTLWYRPPELLLGSTDYGVTVDLWSTGCILAELFTGKPIMPGRTEVEQLHKIFKLCGSPSEEYWKKSKLPHATIFKPQQPYKRCVAESFKSLPSSALALVEILLAVEPDARGTTDSALQSEFFTTKPFASEPSSLPKYQPRKEIDVKAREEEAKRKKGTSGKQNESKQASRDSKAVPAPDANAELLTSIQKRQGQNNKISMSEKFNPDEDAASFRIEPLKSGTAQNGHPRYGVSSVNRNGENVIRGSSRSPRKELRTQRSFVQRGAAQLSRFSNSVAARDGSHFAIANPRWLEDRYNNDNGRQNDGDWSQRLVVKPKKSTKDKESLVGNGEKTERMHYSGPLISSGENLDEMLKEHLLKSIGKNRNFHMPPSLNLNNLTKEPDARGTTDSALQSEFFTTKPFASEPSSLPKYQPRKEIDVKAREEEAKRKKGTSGKQNESKQASRDSKAVPAPDANAELLTSIQKRQGQNNKISMSEKFNPDEDAASFRIEPLKSGTAQNGHPRYGVSSVNRNGENVIRGSSRSPRKELRTQRSFVQRGAAQLSRFSNSVAARDGSHFAIANPRWLEDRYNNDNGRQNDGDWSQRLVVKPKKSTKDKESLVGNGEKTERMHYSGPLISSGENLDEMLKEHERQIQLAVRKARVDKNTNRDDKGQTRGLLAANGR